jgi:hypothetical protein
MIEDDGRAPGSLTRFFTILIGFCLLDLVSWPIFFSYYLWVFADRSNFLNLDYLLDQHLRLGVDTFYSYGLLPVLIQHALFSMFGRGYWPMVGCTVVVLILMAMFWSRFVGYLSRRWIYLVAVVAISPYLLWINPNFPYSLVQLSMLFALLFLLEGRAEVALAVSVIGCFSVPSLPLLLTGLLGLYIVADWWTGDNRSFSELVRRVAPGILTYVLLGIGLSAFFGYKSVLATALPIMGVRFYYGSGKVDFNDLITFLHPAGHSFKYYIAYYIGSPATWWILGTVGLIILGAMALRVMMRDRRPDPRHAVVLFCAILQGFFALVAYRGSEQHIIYDPITAAGVFVGIATFPVKWSRNFLLIVFACIGVMGAAGQARRTLAAWKNTHPSALSANLYAEPEYGPQLAEILQIASTQKVLMMSNATGVHSYYPTLKSADSWFLVAAQMFPSDKARVLANIRDADVVVEDTTHVPYFTDRDPDVQAELRSMCLTDVTRDFQIWWRHPPESAVCKPNQRQTRSSAESMAAGR